MAECGTRSGYVMGCRCEACGSVARTYAKEYRRRRFASKKVSAEIAREAIADLRSGGMGYVAIGEACDMSPATVMRIAQGKQKRIYQVTEERLMRVTPDALKDGALVEKTATTKRLRKLKDEGFSYRQISRALGCAQLSLLKGSSDKVTARTQSRVERLYRLAMRDSTMLRSA